MQVDPREFLALDLRCHSLLGDVPLHDVWTISLSGGGPGRTMTDVLAVSPLREDITSSHPAVRALFGLRRALGTLFGWDRPRQAMPAESYVHRLTTEDRARSAVVPGTRRGSFQLLYVFPTEAVAEIRNATVHAFLVTALVPRPDGHLLYWAIYVKPTGLLTPLYMALIDPFRHYLVYPVLIRETEAAWARAYG